MQPRIEMRKSDGQHERYHSKHDSFWLQIEESLEQEMGSF